MKLVRDGILLILIGPAGVGKSTISKRLISHNKNLKASVSATTRPLRTGEVNGEHYFSVTHQEFERMISEDAFYEWEKVHTNYYGTLKSFVNESISGGGDLLLDIDIRGAVTFRNSLPKNSVVVFLLPPAVSELVERMKSRGTVDHEDISNRLKTAQYEFQRLLSEPEIIDYIVVNEDLDESFQEINSILLAETLKRHRVSTVSLEAFVKEGL